MNIKFVNKIPITDIKARQILDSRGNPTIEVEVITENASGLAMVPSGASTGIYEALELRDNNKNIYHGKSVLKAVGNIDQIKKVIIGMNVLDQTKIDKAMIKADGTKNKSKFGANAILGVSLATARCAANSINVPLYLHLANISETKNKDIILPTPYANIINGGKHAGGDLKMQEFMIAPVGIKLFDEKVRAISEIYQTLKLIIKKQYGVDGTHVGDEGGFAPNLKTPYEALDLICKAIKQTGYDFRQVKIAMDPAASEFYNSKKKTYIMDKEYTKKEMVNLYLDLIKKYPITSLEDPFDQDDFESFKMLMEKIPKKCQLVGDDLLVTNISRIKKVAKKNACNALLLKVNQIGSLTESINAFKLAKEFNWNTMVSHRSGETEDSFIADLVVALGTKQAKIGAPCRSDRTSKYNRLLKINEDLN